MNIIRQQGWPGTVLALAGLYLSPPAYSEEPIPFSVVAQLTPTNCTIDVNGRQPIDYGDITRNQMDATGAAIALLPRTVPVAIRCDAPTAISLAFVDERPNTANLQLAEHLRAARQTGTLFGLGEMKVRNNAAPVGAFTLGLGPVQVDATPRFWSQYNGADHQPIAPVHDWVPVTSANAGNISYSVTTRRGYIVPGTAFNTTLSVVPVLSPLRDMSNDTIHLDGEFTIEIKHL